ncbi:MAG TPA: MMPL family transporter [Acidimicrobiales bacterium]|nr:MMPL family transporter [Acidimicrobiales bacterium]
MRALATWCVRHRRLVVAFWIVALVVVSGISKSVGSDYSNSFTFPKTESADAIHLLQAASPKVSGDTDQIVFATSGATKVTDPVVEARINAMLAKVAKVPHVTTIVSPYGAGGSRQVGKDQQVAFASVTFDTQAQNLKMAVATDLVNTAKSADGGGVTVGVSGRLAENAVRPSFGSGTLFGVLLAGIVLWLVFGSVFAMGLPLISALASLGTAIGLIGMLSNVIRMPEFSTTLVLLIGLGVGIDYALFIVTRHRQGLIAGIDPESSIVNAVNTSGRAVLFAGIIVCIALLGMFALGVSFLYGLAVAAALGVALTMIAALTLLPALLGFIGPRVLSRRQKKSLAENGPRIVGTGTKGFWPRWAGIVQQRPVIPAVMALILIIVVALPFFSLRLGSADQGNDPAGSATRVGYDLLARGFGPGFNGPLELVAVVHNPSERSALSTVVSEVAAQPDVQSVAPPVLIPSHDGSDVALINVYPSSAPQDAATTALVYHLRQQTIPAAVSGTKLTVLVGGSTAIFIDFAHVLSAKLPLFIGLVVLLSFLLLSVVFRSIVIPLVSAAMNVLSIGAAFGVLVAVFQWGWLGSVFGVNRAGPIEAFLPVMLFAILFGLSMDYQVFLVTRIHEEWLKSGDNRTAVRNGLAATGKTITAAALIMILVFGSFILGGERVIKEFGLGLAAGILMDAVVIRMAVVPSVMLLIGKPNWWFPKSLDRLLPHIGLEQAEGKAGIEATTGDHGGGPQDLVGTSHR